MNTLVFDKQSLREFDANGNLFVASCHLTKEGVFGYRGDELPGWEALGLDPDRIYRIYRPAEELKKAVKTFNALPLLDKHVPFYADDPRRDVQIGNLGTDAVWNAPYLDNSLIIQDRDAIEDLGIEGDDVKEQSEPRKKELSASYAFNLVMEAGKFQGESYEGYMKDIKGNHVALVEKGRAGDDVIVSDEDTVSRKAKTMKEGMSRDEALASVMDSLRPLMDVAKPLTELVEILKQDGVEPHPGGEEEAKQQLAGQGDNDEPRSRWIGANDEDKEEELYALLDSLQDKELAESVKALGRNAPAGDEDKGGSEEDGEDKGAPAKDSAENQKEEPAKPAMDSALQKGKKTMGKLAMDEAAITRRVTRACSITSVA